MPNGLSELQRAYTHRVNWPLLREGLRRARNMKGLTLKAASAATALNIATIHSIENVKREPRLKPELETIERLVFAYGLSLTQFFAGLESVLNVTALPDTDGQDPAFPSSFGKAGDADARSIPAPIIVHQFTDEQFAQLLRLTEGTPTTRTRLKQATNPSARKPRRRGPRAKSA